MTAAGPADQFFVDDDEPPRPAKRRGSRWILGGAAALVILALLAAGVYLFSLQRSYGSNVTNFPEPEAGSDEIGLAEEDRPEDTEATSILLLGTDAGGGSGEDEDLPRVPGGGRSDTMMLVHVPESGDSVQVISIPRDLWVEIPGGYGWHKVNAGLALGGDQGHWLARATVEDLLDVRIDHVTAVDLLGFVGLIEEIGGVSVNSGYAEPFTTSDGYTFTPGEQFMDADQALSFVRHRSSFPDGDLQRIRNQQAVIRAVIEQSASPSNLANPLQANNMVSTFSSHLMTDADLTATRAASLVWDARDATGDIQFATLPNGGSGWSPDGQWIWNQDSGAQDEISQALRDGTLGDYLSD